MLLLQVLVFRGLCTHGGVGSGCLAQEQDQLIEADAAGLPTAAQWGPKT